MTNQTLNNVTAAAKAKAATSPEWLRAIEKASKMLQSGELVVTLLQHDALVTSPRSSYKVNGSCPCASRRANCYHRAAVRLVEMMEEAERAEAAARRCDAIIEDIRAIAADIQAPSRAQVINDIKTTWSARFPGESLADELLRRFRCNQLEMLSVDFLTAIKAAIA